ncbi:long-chain-fatty-acid--CoA ligase [bacterium MnTg02]|nr:long-chain-fatty-acid--CoA ligase [bacterium MnTg02]
MNENVYAKLTQDIGDGNRPFLLCEGGREIAYRAFDEETARFANALIALGVTPGDRVAAQVQKSPEALMLYFATLRVGAAFLPLNTAYTARELRYFLGDAEPVLMVCNPADREGINSLAQETGVKQVETLGPDGDGSLMERVSSQSPEFETVAREGDDLAAILYTSGTTGRSKGAMLTHRNLTSNAEALKEFWRFTSDDRLLHALPIFHTHGLFTATNTLMLAGGSMVFLPRFDAERVIELLGQATSMMAVPTFYSRLLQQPDFTRERVSHMRVFISGSAPLSSEIYAEFKERTGYAILERYGMTETGMNTSNPYDGDRRSGTVGLPLPGVEIRIADPETGEPLPQGNVGMIEIRGPNVFKGYWRMPEKTKEEMRADGFFVSGDLGLLDDRGYVHIVGREKDLIITGGFNVYPAEVEAAIDALPGVVESAVIGVAHPDFGEGVTAVVAALSAEDVDEDDILFALGSELAGFKQPKRVFVVDALPRNSMGKIQKNELRERFKDAYSGG